MKKKLLALLLCATMLLSLAACGGSGNSGSDNQQNASAGNNQPESGDSNAKNYNAENGNGSESGQPDTQDEQETSGKEITFQEMTVVDNDECTLKLTGIDPDNTWGYTIKAYLENKSAEKTYMFSLRESFINGVECGSFFATEVAPGKKSNEEISLTTDDLEAAGITEFTDIELYFHVYDSDDWTADAAADETVHVYPYGEENAVQFVREAQPEDNVILDNDYATVIVTGYEMDDIWGYTANLFLVNKSDKEVMIAVDDASVNGFMADPFWSHSLMPGKCAFSSMSWSEDDLTKNGIEEVTEIQFTLRVYDANDWTADKYAEDNIVLNP